MKGKKKFQQNKRLNWIESKGKRILLRIINQTKEQKNHSDTKSKDLINIEDLDNLSKRERSKKKKKKKNHKIKSQRFWLFILTILKRKKN